MFRAHVEATFESAHKNGPPGHKCAGTIKGLPHDLVVAINNYPMPHKERITLIDYIESTCSFDYHGHSWLCEIEWNYDETKLDEHLWGPDFGKVKDMIRRLDHHNLNLIFDQPSAEFIAKKLYNEFWQQFGFFPDFVRLHEGRGNTMVYSGE